VIFAAETAVHRNLEAETPMNAQIARTPQRRRVLPQQRELFDELFDEPFDDDGDSEIRRQIELSGMVALDVGGYGLD
jgi:hypothetical protein